LDVSGFPVRTIVLILLCSALPDRLWKGLQESDSDAHGFGQRDKWMLETFVSRATGVLVDHADL
jgi:hypothetical protein